MATVNCTRTKRRSARQDLSVLGLDSFCPLPLEAQVFHASTSMALKKPQKPVPEIDCGEGRRGRKKNQRDVQPSSGEQLPAREKAIGAALPSMPFHVCASSAAPFPLVPQQQVQAALPASEGAPQLVQKPPSPPSTEHRCTSLKPYPILSPLLRLKGKGESGEPDERGELLELSSLVLQALSPSLPGFCPSSRAARLLSLLGTG